MATITQGYKGEMYRAACFFPTSQNDTQNRNYIVERVVVGISGLLMKKIGSGRNLYRKRQDPLLGTETSWKAMDG